MQTPQILTIHKQLLDIYYKSIVPIVDKYFGSDINYSQEKAGEKYAPTLVTEADIAVNDILLENLPKLVPGAGLISEENKINSVSKYTFIIDPIDGTHSFARNLDDWGISIELVEEEIVIYSIIFYPNCKTKYFYAIKGLGAFDSKNNKIAPIKFFSFRPSYISAPNSRKICRSLIEYSKDKTLSLRAYGSAVYSFYTLLRGGIDFLVFDDLYIWDILGCAFIAEQAGLVVEYVSKKPVFNKDTDFKKALYTLMIYKPDFEKNLLSEFKQIVYDSTKDR